jgi:hypothetical protein
MFENLGHGVSRWNRSLYVSLSPTLHNIVSVPIITKQMDYDGDEHIPRSGYCIFNLISMPAMISRVGGLMIPLAAGVVRSYR